MELKLTGRREDAITRRPGGLWVMRGKGAQEEAPSGKSNKARILDQQGPPIMSCLQARSQAPESTSASPSPLPCTFKQPRQDPHWPILCVLPSVPFPLAAPCRPLRETLSFTGLLDRKKTDAFIS